jgi:hypothetical protein
MIISTLGLSPKEFPAALKASASETRIIQEIVRVRAIAACAFIAFSRGFH